MDTSFALLGFSFFTILCRFRFQRGGFPRLRSAEADLVAALPAQEAGLEWVGCFDDSADLIYSLDKGVGGPPLLLLPLSRPLVDRPTSGRTTTRLMRGTRTFEGSGTT